MRPNNVRAMWQRDESVYNGWLMIPSSVPAEMMARQGWDSITIDMQHGMIDYTDALPMLQAISVTDSTPIVRVPSLESGIIGKMLDAGAYGIICPMVNNRAQCELFVKSCRYAPLGHRSMGPVRATMYAGPDYAAHANDTVIAMAMIETEEAVQNLDEIMSTPGLDAIFVGPSDLSVSMGHAPGFDPRFPEGLRRDQADRGCRQTAQCRPRNPYDRSSTRARWRLWVTASSLTLSEFRFMALHGAQSLTALRSGAIDHAASQAKSY